MQFNILGPLEVSHDNAPVGLGGIKQRAVLGMLLLNANSVVSSSKLLNSMWTDDIPRSGRQILQNAASALRVILSYDNGNSDSPALLTHRPGYMLRADPETIDAQRFARLAVKGREASANGSWELARKYFHEALGTWRGPVLSDLTENGISWPELSIIENSRLNLLEDNFEAELACGRHQEVVGELEAMVETEFSRERLCGQLMLALYRCGRQLDALSVYRRTRGALIEQYGVEPSTELQALERSILTHAPDLGWHGSTSAPLVDSAPSVPSESGNPAPGQAVSEAPLRSGIAAAEPQPAISELVAGRIDIPAPEEFSLMLIVAGANDALLGDEHPSFSRRRAAAISDEIVHRVSMSQNGEVVLAGPLVSLVRFRADRGDPALRAAQSAISIRDAVDGQFGGPDDGNLSAPTIRIAIVSNRERGMQNAGEAIPDEFDQAFRQCLQMASAAPGASIVVDSHTKRATEGMITCEQAGGADGGAWIIAPRTAPTFVEIGRANFSLQAASELELLGSLLDAGGINTSPLDALRDGRLNHEGTVKLELNVMVYAAGQPLEAAQGGGAPSPQEIQVPSSDERPSAG